MIEKLLAIISLLLASLGFSIHPIATSTPPIIDSTPRENLVANVGGTIISQPPQPVATDTPSIPVQTTQLPPIIIYVQQPQAPAPVVTQPEVTQTPATTTVVATKPMPQFTIGPTVLREAIGGGTDKVTITFETDVPTKAEIRLTNNPGDYDTYIKQNDMPEVDTKHSYTLEQSHSTATWFGVKIEADGVSNVFKGQL